MRLNPLDIRKQDFKRAFRGFEPEEVEAFLMMLANQWQEILDAERKLEDKVRELEAKLKHYVTIEEALQQALKTTRDSAKQTLENAKEKAALIIEEAENRAVEIKKHAEEERHQLKRDTAKVSGRRNEIVARLRAFLMSEMELLARYEGDDPVGFIRLMPADERRLSAADVGSVSGATEAGEANPKQTARPREEDASSEPEAEGESDPLAMPPPGGDEGAAAPEVSAMEDAVDEDVAPLQPAPVDEAWEGEEEVEAESLLSAAAAFLDHSAQEPGVREEADAVAEPESMQEPEVAEEPEALEEAEELEGFGAPISLEEAASLAAMTVMDKNTGVVEEEDDLEEEEDLAPSKIDLTLPESVVAAADEEGASAPEPEKVVQRIDAPAKAKSGEPTPVKKTPVTESTSSKPGWVLHSLLSPSADDEEAPEQKTGGITASADELAEIRRILDDLD